MWITAGTMAQCKQCPGARSLACEGSPVTGTIKTSSLLKTGIDYVTTEKNSHEHFDPTKNQLWTRIDWTNHFSSLRWTRGNSTHLHCLPLKSTVSSGKPSSPHLLRWYPCTCSIVRLYTCMCRNGNVNGWRQFQNWNRLMRLPARLKSE